MAQRPEYIRFNKNNIDHELKTCFINDLFKTNPQNLNEIHSHLLALGKFSIEDSRLSSQHSINLVMALEKLHLISFYNKWQENYKKGNANMENIKSYAQLQLDIISTNYKLTEKPLFEEEKMGKIISVFHSAINHTFSSHNFIFNKNSDQINKNSLLFQNKLNYVLENWESINDQLYEHNLISSDYHLLSTSLPRSSTQDVNGLDEVILFNYFKEININNKEPLMVFKKLQQISKLGFQKACFDLINPISPNI